MFIISDIKTYIDEVQFIDNDGYTLIMRCLMKKPEQPYEVLMKVMAKSELNMTSQQGDTALMIAIKNEISIEIVKELIYKTCLTIKNNKNEDAYTILCENKKKNVCLNSEYLTSKDWDADCHKKCSNNYCSCYY